MSANEAVRDESEGRPRVACGDVELARLRSRLLRHARRLLGERDVAEDLVQETLIGVFRGWAACRGEACLETWATAILRHKVADWFRADAQRVDKCRVGSDGGDGGDRPDADSAAGCNEPDPCTFATPDRELERRQLASAIDAGIERLPARSRQLFAMHEQLGFDTDEVCQRLGISAAHCRKLLYRARLTMRGQLRARRFAP